ncbi:MAG: CotH kinase family protein, partial [Thermoanaerobaculia bacterium]
VSTGEKPFNATALVHEAARWEELTLPRATDYLREGENLLAVHAINQSIANDDFSFDLELVVPARGELPAEPTPGAQNSVYGENAPPQLRQVASLPLEPEPDEPFIVTGKATDPDGVASVSLRYQVVPPGKFIPAELSLTPAELMARPTQVRRPNPAFEDPASWIELAMADDGKGADAAAGDGIYTCLMPPQKSRTLVRWRITAADPRGAAVTVPHADDPSLNFACFVHGGVPPFATTRATVHPEGAGYSYPLEALTAVPVYFLIARAQEIAECVAYNPAWQIPKSNEAARDAFNWEGTFVYEGEVYDHIHFRLRQANDRYGGTGKRSWRVRFPKGNYLRARDALGRRYPTRWRTLNTGKMFDNKGVGNFGLTETLNELLWNAVGTPAPFAQIFHFRVVQGPEEAPAGPSGQHLGDFWGMALALEDYDPRFLDAHDLADGNLYKLKDGIFTGNDLKRNQGRFSVKTDADFQNIRANLRPTKPAAWLDQHVNYDRWYPYHTVVEAIRHYDFVPADSHSKNRAWYFEPAEGSPLGRLWTMPWDADASWGPNWNEGIDYSTQAIATGADKAPFRLKYRNFIREFRDLLWQEEELNPLIDWVAAPIVELAKADRDRWRGAPASAGSQDFGTLEAKILDMKRFAFVGWSGSTGPPVPAGGRARHLDLLSAAEGDAAAIPRTPTVTSKAPAGFPIDELTFECSAFGDPQGDATFAALKWRLAEV